MKTKFLVTIEPDMDDISFLTHDVEKIFDKGISTFVRHRIKVQVERIKEE